MLDPNDIMQATSETHHVISVKMKIAIIYLVFLTCVGAMVVYHIIYSQPLTFGGHGDLFAFIGYTWASTGSPSYVDITVKNICSTDFSITITEVRVDGNRVTSKTTLINPSGSFPYLLKKEDQVTLHIIGTATGNFTHGIQYDFTVVTPEGPFGPYTLTAP